MIQRSSSVEAAIALRSKWAAPSSFGLAYAFFSNVTPSPSVIWPSFAWRLPKHAFILWLCAKEKLLTRDRLPFLDDRSCVLSSSSCMESIDHLFFHSDITRSLWLQVQSWLHMIHSMTTIRAAFKWFKKEYRRHNAINMSRMLAFASTMYAIWKARNNLIFENEVPLVEASFHKIKIFVFRCLYLHFSVTPTSFLN